MRMPRSEALFLWNSDLKSRPRFSGEFQTPFGTNQALPQSLVALLVGIKGEVLELPLCSAQKRYEMRWNDV